MVVIHISIIYFQNNPHVNISTLLNPIKVCLVMNKSVKERCFLPFTYDKKQTFCIVKLLLSKIMFKCTRFRRLCNDFKTEKN